MLCIKNEVQKKIKRKKRIERIEKKTIVQMDRINRKNK